MIPAPCMLTLTPIELVADATLTRHQSAKIQHGHAHRDDRWVQKNQPLSSSGHHPSTHSIDNLRARRTRLFSIPASTGLQICLAVLDTAAVQAKLLHQVVFFGICPQRHWKAELSGCHTRLRLLRELPNNRRNMTLSARIKVH